MVRLNVIKQLFLLISSLFFSLFLMIGFEIKNENILYNCLIEKMEYNTVAIIKYSIINNEHDIYFDKKLFEEKLIEKTLLDLKANDIIFYRLSVGYFDEEQCEGVGVCLNYKKTYLKKEIKLNYLLTLY